MVPFLDIRSGNLTASPASVKRARPVRQQTSCAAQSRNDCARIFFETELFEPVRAIAANPQPSTLAMDLERLVFTGALREGANCLGAVVHGQDDSRSLVK